MLMNIAQDSEDDQRKLELLLRFINPSAAEAVFDKTIEITDVSDEEFLKEINEHTSSPLTSLNSSPRASSEDDRLDSIERVQ